MGEPIMLEQNTVTEQSPLLPFIDSERKGAYNQKTRRDYYSLFITPPQKFYSLKNNRLGRACKNLAEDVLGIIFDFIPEYEEENYEFNTRFNFLSAYHEFRKIAINQPLLWRMTTERLWQRYMEEEHNEKSGETEQREDIDFMEFKKRAKNQIRKRVHLIQLMTYCVTGYRYQRFRKKEQFYGKNGLVQARVATAR